MNNWLMRMLVCAAAMLAGVPAARADVTVSAAISLKGALEKSQAELEKAAGEKIVFNFGASGTLAGQIQQGAPVDLFISADRATVDKLVAAMAGDKESEKAIAGNELVLIASPLSSRTKPNGFADIPRFGKIAIGDPKTVPAGAYAKELLTHLKIYDDLDKAGKIVTTENVAQVQTFVQRGEVELGIVYATDAKAAAVNMAVATADSSMHSPIEYVSVVVTASKKKDAAAKIQTTLTGEKVQAFLKEAGFTAPPAPATSTKPK